jgi:predicted flap endonuclease-1-like 5' DNA nuclease
MNKHKAYLRRTLGVDGQTAARLIQAGMTHPGAIAELSEKELQEVGGMDRATARALRQRTATPEQVDLELDNGD